MRVITCAAVLVPQGFEVAPVRQEHLHQPSVGSASATIGLILRCHARLSH